MGWVKFCSESDLNENNSGSEFILMINPCEVLRELDFFWYFFRVKEDVTSLLILSISIELNYKVIALFNIFYVLFTRFRFDGLLCLRFNLLAF